MQPSNQGASSLGGHLLVSGGHPMIQQLQYQSGQGHSSYPQMQVIQPTHSMPQSQPTSMHVMDQTGSLVASMNQNQVQHGQAVAQMQQMPSPHDPPIFTVDLAGNVVRSVQPSHHQPGDQGMSGSSQELSMLINRLREKLANDPEASLLLSAAAEAARNQRN